MSTAARLLSLTALIAASAACTSWSRLADSQPVPSRGTVQVWSAGENIVLRDPRKLGDSLLGQRPLPDTTRRAVALSDIDSVRTQDLDPGKMLIVGAGVGVVVWSVIGSSMAALRD